MRSGIKKRTSKCSKRKLRASRGALHRSIVTSLHWTCDSMAKDFRARRGEATCQINVTMAKFCCDEACYFLAISSFALCTASGQTPAPDAEQSSEAPQLEALEKKTDQK